LAALVAVTLEARHTLGGAREVHLTFFPFRFGRESRSPNPDPDRPAGLRLGLVPSVNDVYLIEPPHSDVPYISREHFAIEYIGDQFLLLDRGSLCGTIVNGKRVGRGGVGGRAELRHGDTIVVGTAESDYRFRFDISPSFLFQ
jgi:hypothetical protein